jgi:hypothetical protein
MHLPQIAIACAFAMALLGCSQPAAPIAVTKPVIPKTEAECIARGGSWTTLGLPMPDKPKTCDLKTNDSGRTCTDSKQCQGACLAPAGVATGAVATGSCSPYVANFGNVGLVTDGKVEQVNVE